MSTKYEKQQTFFFFNVFNINQLRIKTDLATLQANADKIPEIC